MSTDLEYGEASLSRRLLISVCRRLVVLPLFAACAQAPEPEFDSVVDKAELLSPKAEERIRALGRDLRERHGIPIAVVTIESLEAEGASGMTIGAFAAELTTPSLAFYEEYLGQDWTSGVLYLFSRDDVAMSIYLGLGWEPEARQELQQLSNEAFLPHFNQRKYSKAFIASLEALDRHAASAGSPTFSHLDRFVRIQKEAFTAFLGKLKDPTWTTIFGFIPWAAFLFFVWEVVRPWRTNQRHLRKGIGLDIFYTVLNTTLFWALIGTAVCTTTSVAFRLMLSHFFGIQNMVAVHLNNLPQWSQYLLLLLLLDLSAYWIHRLLHASDFLWEFHKVHHSATELDAFNAIRLHFGEALVYRAVAYVPLGMIGFGVEDAFVVTVFIGLFSFFTHANVRIPLGPLKYVLNNPQLHIWHHAKDQHPRGNVNFGDALSMWDFIFGSAYSPPEKSTMPLGFDGIEEYPTTFLGQLVVPFSGMLQVARQKASGLRGS